MQRTIICFWWRLKAILGYVALSIINRMILHINRAEEDKYNTYKCHRKESIEIFWNNWNHHIQSDTIVVNLK